LGIGFMGRVHTEALRRLGNVEVIDVAGRTAQAARKFADNLGIERATGNYQDLLADADVSVVHNLCSQRSALRHGERSHANGQALIV
jgi:predicted dehydrogenase